MVTVTSQPLSREWRSSVLIGKNLNGLNDHVSCPLSLSYSSQGGAFAA